MFATLRADLRRAHALERPPGAEPSRLAFLSPRFAPVLLCRVAHWLHLHRLGPVAKLVALLNFVVFGIEIAARCPIGEDLYFPHTQGTVVGAERIGKNAIIYQGVTLSARDMDFAYSEGRRPVVEDDVLIGSGAKVLGGITLGRGVSVGANALVVKSVAAGALVRAPLPEVLDAIAPVAGTAP